jgi:hypothetical protein
MERKRLELEWVDLAFEQLPRCAAEPWQFGETGPDAADRGERRDAQGGRDQDQPRRHRPSAVLQRVEAVVHGQGRTVRIADDVNGLAGAKLRAQVLHAESRGGREVLDLELP